MAWDDITFRGTRGVSGDKPIDEMALALERIAGHYQRAFSRKPTVAEVLYALDAVLGADPGRYTQEGAAAAAAAAAAVDPSQYEGAYADEPEPGHYVVQRKPAPAGGPEVEVIHVPRLKVEGRTLVCEYRLLDPAVGHEGAKLLIREVLLNDFCDRHYDALADEVDFRPVG